MIIKKYYGKPMTQTFSEIVDQYSIRALNSIKTSTVPLLQYWKDAEKGLNFLKNRLDISMDEVALCFEYPTPSSGSSKCSMTDLMLIGKNFKIAIEGKYTEVKKMQEKTVEEWYTKSDNRTSVLNHWISILKPYLMKEETTIDDIRKLPYQFLHRVASSCYERPEKAFVIYQVFYDNETKDKAKEFCNLIYEAVNILKPAKRLNIFSHLIEVELTIHVDKEEVLQKIKQSDVYRIKTEIFPVHQNAIE